MTIQQLKYIITISENGSLNKAAEVLFITQPSLTSAVRELEKETSEEVWEQKNDALRRLGLRTIPNPGE